MKKTYIVFSIIFVLFWMQSIRFLDSDFGWHLAQGQEIIANGIPKTDLFSYTMPSYSLLIHSWFSEVFFARTFPALGFIGLGALGALLITVGLLIHVRSQNPTLVLVPLLLTASTLLSFIAVRPQVFTWFFFSFLLFLLLQKKPAWLYLIPLIFIVWVNLHGGFAAGIGVLILDLLFTIGTHKKLLLPKIAIILLSILATCINPYGPLIWKEVWMTFFDAPLRGSIAEWQPTIYIVHFSFYFYLALATMLAWRYRKSLPLPLLGLYIVFFVLGLSSNKHVPLFAIFAFPLTIYMLSLFQKEAAKKKGGSARFDRAYKVFSLITLIVVLVQLVSTVQDAHAFSEDSFYPKRAVVYLKQSLPKGQIFSDYGWGGYLIWKLPEKKVYIDGRMAIWRWDGKNSNETDNAFRDYLAVTEGRKSFFEEANKYNIDTVLLPTPTEEKEDIFVNIPILKEIIQRVKKQKPYGDIVSQVKAAGWKEVYRDEVAVIYQKIVDRKN